MKFLFGGLCLAASVWYLVQRQWQFHFQSPLHYKQGPETYFFALSVIRKKDGRLSSAMNPSSSGDVDGQYLRLVAKAREIRQSLGLDGTEDSSGITLDSGK